MVWRILFKRTMEKHHRQENKNKNKLRVLCLDLYCLINKLTQTAMRKQLNIEIYFLGPFSIHGCQCSVAILIVLLSWPQNYVKGT